MMVCITCDEHENPARLTFNGILNLIRSIEEVEIWITYRFSNDRHVLVCQNMCLLSNPISVESYLLKITICNALRCQGWVIIRSCNVWRWMKMSLIL